MSQNLKRKAKGSGSKWCRNGRQSGLEIRITAAQWNLSTLEQKHFFWFVLFLFFTIVFFFSRVSIRKMHENRCESIWRTSVHRWFQNNSVKKSRTSGGGGGEDVSDTLLSPPSEASGQQGRSQTSDAAAATLSPFYILFLCLCSLHAGKQRKTAANQFHICSGTIYLSRYSGAKMYLAAANFECCTT